MRKNVIRAREGAVHIRADTLTRSVFPHIWAECVLTHSVFVWTQEVFLCTWGGTIINHMLHLRRCIDAVCINRDLPYRQPTFAKTRVDVSRLQDGTGHIRAGCALMVHRAHVHTGSLPTHTILHNCQPHQPPLKMHQHCMPTQSHTEPPARNGAHTNRVCQSHRK